VSVGKGKSSGLLAAVVIIGLIVWGCYHATVATRDALLDKIDPQTSESSGVVSKSSCSLISDDVFKQWKDIDIQWENSDKEKYKNEMEARWIGKKVYFSATVWLIKSDMLEVAAEFNDGIPRDLFIDCVLDNNVQYKIKQVSQGDKITVYGTVSEFTHLSPTLKNCDIDIIN
jgi:hypothetical protein